MDFEDFKKNYKGMLSPQIAYNQAIARIEVQQGKFKKATYSNHYNRQLEKRHINK